MIQRAVTAIIGVVIGLFATFAVFSAILGGLDNFYLLTQDTCNYGSHNSPKRVLRVAPENANHPRNADEIDWTRDGLDLVHDGSGGCDVAGDFDAGLDYLTPTGDRIALNSTGSGGISIDYLSEASLLAGEGLNTTALEFADIWTDGSVAVYLSNVDENSDGSDTVYLFNIGDTAATSYSNLDSSHDYGSGVVFISPNTIWAVDTEAAELHRYRHASARGGIIAQTVSLGHAAIFTDIDVHDGNLYLLGQDGNNSNIYTYGLDGTAGDVYSAGRPLSHTSAYGMTIANDDAAIFYTHPEFAVAPDYRNPAADVVRIRIDDSLSNAQLTGISIGDNDVLYVMGHRGRSVFLQQHQYSAGGGGVALTWLPAENVFTAQQQLVTLLAVIAAIGMPIGAMTAIVFFGQAVISSGVSGQGASQVLVAIAAVVVILVAVQMFQQFAGYLGNAFDAVNGDRFVVFDETLGSLAETIAEFWGVLAFAGLINIATIVWRNYSGNFSMGGTQGGL